MAIRIVLTAFALVPLVFLDDLLLLGPAAQTTTYPGLSAVADLQLQDSGVCPDPTGVMLTMTIQSLDTAQNTVNVDLSLCVGDYVIRDLTVDGTGARPFSHGSAVSQANASLLQSAFRVTYEGAIPETSLSRTVTIGSILDQAGIPGPPGAVDLGTVSMPVSGAAVTYPFDEYSASGDWAVFPPSGMTVTGTGSIRAGWDPVNLGVTATPEAGNLSWDWSYVPRLGYVIQANRITPMKVFVFLIAGLPLLLFCGLLALVQSAMRDRERPRFPAELLVGVGAFLFAVIPVRAVLIPADVSQITVTDYILGTEMAVMVAASLMITFAGTPASGRASKAGIDASPSSHTVALALAESRANGTKPSLENTTDAPGDRTLRTDRPSPKSSAIPAEPQIPARRQEQNRTGLDKKAMLGLAGVAAVLSIRRLLNRTNRTQ